MDQPGFHLQGRHHTSSTLLPPFDNVAVPETAERRTPPPSVISVLCSSPACKTSQPPDRTLSQLWAVYTCFLHTCISKVLDTGVWVGCVLNQDNVVNWGDKSIDQFTYRFHYLIPYYCQRMYHQTFVKTNKTEHWKKIKARKRLFPHTL